MTGSIKKIRTLLIGIVVIVFLASVSFYVLEYFLNIEREKNATLAFDGTSQMISMKLGSEYEVYKSNSICYDSYIEMLIGPNDTYQLAFYNGEKRNLMIADSGIWAKEISMPNGSKPIVLLIPDYIAQKGYDRITLTPIRGDGVYFVESVQTLQEKGQSQYSNANVLDFEIKQLELTIDEQDYSKIEVKREEALDLGILLADDEDIVPAVVKADGQNYKTELRLKGDWTDHLMSDQWSFRIDVKGDHCIYGLQKFSIQRKETRNGIWEYLIYEMYRDQGGVALRYDFADVFINGIYKGVYAVEEFMEKRVIENSQKREGPILRISEDLVWEQWAYITPQFVPSENPVEIGIETVIQNGDTDSLKKKKAPAGIEFSINVFSEKKTLESSTLSGYAAYAITQMNKLIQGTVDADQVFDVELFAKLHAILDLFGASHGRIWHNMRNYYNPVTALLEPIPFDELAFYDVNLLLPNHEVAIEKELFKSEAHNKVYVDYVKQLISEWPAIWEVYTDQIDQLSTIILRDDYYFDVPEMSDLDERRMKLNNMFDIAVSVSLEKDSETSAYKLTLANDGDLKVHITGVYNDQSAAKFTYKDSDPSESVTIPQGATISLHVVGLDDEKQLRLLVSNLANQEWVVPETIGGTVK